MINENIEHDNGFDPEDNVVVITNINFHCKNEMERRQLPTDFTVNVPKNLRPLFDSNYDKFIEKLEEFVYNFLYRLYKHEVNFCQIYF